MDANIATRGHEYKLQVRKFIHNFRKHFFSFRIVEVWNALKADTVNAPSVDAFRARLCNGANVFSQSTVSWSRFLRGRALMQ